LYDTEKVLKVQSGGLELIELVGRNYLSDPINYAYLLYDLAVYPNVSKALLRLEDDVIVGYALAWFRFEPQTVILYGELRGVPLYEVLRLKSLVWVPFNEYPSIERELLKYGSVSDKRVMLDMVATPDTFPWDGTYVAKCVKLKPSDIDALQEFWNSVGVRVPREVLLEALNDHVCYGVFIDGKLVSVARTYVRTPHVWVVGGVFTHPNFRGRGFAKAVTAAVTREALLSGAYALLHVREDNYPAIRAYRRIGYELIGRRVWVSFTPRVM
jgi:GNAT superfamily N-acetyltransferase